MFENFFGGKKKSAEEEVPVLPDKEELAARSAAYTGKAEFSLGEDPTEVKKQEEMERSGWNASMMTARDEAIFQKEHRDGAPIEYEPVHMDDDEKNAA